MKNTLTNNDTVISVVAIIFAMISITVGASLAKTMFLHISPESVTFLRLTIAALILCLVLRIWEVRLSPNNMGSVCLYGGTIAGMNLFFYLAIKSIPIGVALAIELIGPLLVSIIFSQKRTDLLWAILAACGIYFLIPSATSSSELDPIGIIYAGIAAFFWGAYVIIGKKAGSQHGAKAPALGLVVASILLLPIGIDTLQMSSLSLNLVFLIILVALLSSLIPLVLEMKALRHLPTKTYGVLTSAEPVVGTFTSLLILGEQLNALQSLGITIIVIASIGSVLSPIEKKALIH